MADAIPATAAPATTALANFHCRTRIRGEDLFLVQEEIAVPVLAGEAPERLQQRLIAAAKKLEGRHRDGCYEKRFIGFSDKAAEALQRLRQQQPSSGERRAIPGVKFVPAGEAGKSIENKDVKKVGGAR